MLTRRLLRSSGLRPGQTPLPRPASPQPMETHHESSPVSRAAIYSRDEHCISRADIDPDALRIMQRLTQHGFKAYLVGGGVRDLLLRKKPKDFDIATDATPRRVKAIFGNSRIIGRRFKLVHVFFGGGKIIEVSTFRDSTDEALEGDDQENDTGEAARLAQDNRFGTEETDAIRRDITINGLFYDLSTLSIIDYVGGVKDLEAGIVRVIGDPDVRFSEDPVRMIRVVRHAARSGFTIDAAAVESIERLHHLINDCPPMRIYEELKKDFYSGHYFTITQLLHQTGLLQHLLPELTSAWHLQPHSRFSEALKRCDEQARLGTPLSNTATLALIALCASGTLDREDPYALDDRENSPTEFLKGLFQKLAVPRRERERIEDVLNGWFDLGAPPYDEERLDRLANRLCGPDIVMLLYVLGIEGMDPEIIEEARHASQEELPPEPRRRPRRRGPGGRGEGGDTRRAEGGRAEGGRGDEGRRRRHRGGRGRRGGRG